MRAIIFECVDIINDTYKYVVVCKENEVNETIEKQKSLSTEIVGYEIAYVKIN